MLLKGYLHKTTRLIGKAIKEVNFSSWLEGMHPKLVTSLQDDLNTQRFKVRNKPKL